MNKLFQIAQRSSVTVEYCHIPLNESISVEDAAGDFVLLNYGLISARAKERTHLVHELGHCVTGSFYSRHSGLDVRQKRENRADKWAIEELIGEAALNAAVSEGNTEVWQLADYFNVSEEMMKKAICLYKFGNLDVDSYFGQ